MGVYIKKVQASKIEAIFKMLGLNIKDGDIIEVPEPHGRLIDADEVMRDVKRVGCIYGNNWYCRNVVVIKHAPTVIEAEEER